MKNITLISIILILLLSFGCNSPKFKIKKDLDSRFTKFEIVEIKEDSSNVYTAINTIIALGFRTSETNLEIIKTLNKIERETSVKKIYKNYLYIDSLHNNITKAFDKFEKSKYDKVDHCYYIKYLVFKDERKIPQEEYYYINQYNGELIHRPYNWDDFLYEQKYNVLIKEALKYSSEIFDLEWKYKKR